MLENNLELMEDISAKIDELFVEISTNKAQVLTETDFQCLMYQKLSQIDLLSEIGSTRDGYFTNKIHTEISFFDSDGQLRVRPDITLMIPDNLTISQIENTRLPSKGFSSTDGGIIFELKFDRQATRISEETISGIIKDIENFSRLLQRYENTQHGIYGYFVLLVKSAENQFNQVKIERIRGYFENIPEEKYKFIVHYLEV